MSEVRDALDDLEQSLLKPILDAFPQARGMSIEVEIRQENRRTRGDTSVESWQPARDGEIRIHFGAPARAESRPRDYDAVGPRDYDAVGNESADPPLDAEDLRRDLLESLEIAERRPGFDFVALKWFRDLFLPAECPDWAESRPLRDRAVRSAIEDGVILTNKVPNPKNPAFPVTAIRVNRAHPEVIGVLGENDSSGPRFRPVSIRGEPLSKTVLDERR